MGSPQAMFNLGYMYELGIGLEQVSYMYFNLILSCYVAIGDTTRYVLDAMFLCRTITWQSVTMTWLLRPVEKLCYLSAWPSSSSLLFRLYTNLLKVTMYNEV